MAIWKEQTPTKSEPTAPPPNLAPRKEEFAPVVPASSADTTRRPVQRSDAKETLIAADLNIEGKIEGAGHVRVAGRFKGDVHVEGDLTIEAGAKVTGGVRAGTVIIAGELGGNVDAASRVELQQTGVLNGDVKAGSLSVAAGSRMRGQADFGWDDSGRNGKAETRGAQ
jgi:cytoskeletal protein CcmA (bactofilin family)